MTMEIYMSAYCKYFEENESTTRSKISNISHTESQKLNDYHLVLQWPLPNPLNLCQVESEDVDGATLRSDAPTTSVWSTSLFLLSIGNPIREIRQS